MSIKKFKEIWRIARVIHSGGAVIANMRVKAPVSIGSKVTELTLYSLNADPKNQVTISVEGRKGN